MTLGDFIDVLVSDRPLRVQLGYYGIADEYKNTDELIDKNEIGCYGRIWDFDEDIINRITIDSEGILTIEIKEGEI